jgi:hypothetical protein
MQNLDSFAIPMTMGDWVLVMESIANRLNVMKNTDIDSMDDDALSDLYTDQQNLEGIFAYIKIEFEKNYGSLPPNM